MLLNTSLIGWCLLYLAAGAGGLVEYSRSALTDAVALKQRRLKIASSVMTFSPFQVH